MNLDFLRQSKFFTLCIVVTFFLSGLIINFLQLILFTTIKQVNQHLFTEASSYVVLAFYRRKYGEFELRLRRPNNRNFKAVIFEPSMI